MTTTTPSRSTSPIAPAPGAEDAERVIAECDTKLARYREALEAGTDPKLVAQWTAEVQAHRAEAFSRSRQVTGQRRMTKDEIRAMLKPLGPIPDVLADAEPRDKAEVYQQLGLKLIYEPGKQLVRAEATLDPHKLGIWSVSEGGLDRFPMPSIFTPCALQEVVLVGSRLILLITTAERT
ncbi:hypothetical protein ACWELB_39040 [Streptomyces asiaticus]